MIDLNQIVNLIIKSLRMPEEQLINEIDVSKEQLEEWKHVFISGAKKACDHPDVILAFLMYKPIDDKWLYNIRQFTTLVEQFMNGGKNALEQYIRLQEKQIPKLNSQINIIVSVILVSMQEGADLEYFASFIGVTVDELIGLQNLFKNAGRRALQGKYKTKYSYSTKVQIIEECLTTGNKLNIVACKYGVYSKSTPYAWWDKYVTAGKEAVYKKLSEQHKTPNKIHADNIIKIKNILEDNDFQMRVLNKLFALPSTKYAKYTLDKRMLLLTNYLKDTSMSIDQFADKYNIPRSTFKVWVGTLFDIIKRTDLDK